MKVETKEIIKKTKGNCDIINITDDVITLLKDSGLSEGICNIFVQGSTAALTTIEFEPGLIKDIPKLMDKLIPQFQNYSHNETWGDGNGHSHLRSALIKTSYSVPFKKSELYLGTWQQIVLIDFDNRSRTRKVIVQFMGA